MADVAPDPVNPDPRDVGDPPAAVSPYAQNIKDDLKNQWATEFANAGVNINNWAHPIRVILQDGTPDRGNYVGRSNSYRSIKTKKPKKIGANLKVNPDVLTIKRNMLALAQTDLQDAKGSGLLPEDWRVIIRIVPLSGGNPDDQHCGCGCTAGPAE